MTTLRPREGCEVQVTKEGHLRFRGWRVVQDGSRRTITVELQAAVLRRALGMQDEGTSKPPSGGTGR